MGGGVAGLTAAACLAKSGVKNILCEQANRIGGLFNSIWHKGYLCDGHISEWGNVPEKSYDYGSLLCIPKSVSTPIPNLFVAGQWVFPWGGSPIAVLTGRLAADRALKQTRME